MAGRFSLSVTLGRLAASFVLEGGFASKGYALLQASASQSYVPDPKNLFSKSFDFSFSVGIVPVRLTFRQEIDAFFRASASIEGVAFVGFGKGWRFTVGFDYDSSRPRGERFMLVDDFKEDKLMIPDPVFDVRALAEIETGLTFSFDVVLYSLLQGSVSTDIGISGSIEVGANLDTVLVTRPVISLNELGVNFFLTVRAFVGLNQRLTDFVADILSIAGGEDGATCTLEVGSFEFPKIPDLDDDEGDSALESLVEMLDER